MKIKNTYITKTKEERLQRQAELRRRCILLLQASAKGGYGK